MDGFKLHPATPKPTQNLDEVKIGQQKDASPTMSSILYQLVKLQQQAALPVPDIDEFDGTDALSFPSFMKKFHCLVEDVTEDPTRRLEMLLKFTRKEARDLIKDCILISDATAAYQRAVKLLTQTYGHPALLATAFKQKAEAWPKVKAGDKDGLKKYSVFLTNCCTARQGNPQLQNVDSFEFLKVLATKLPTPLQQKWIGQVGVYRDVVNRSPTLEDFNKFVQQLARDENDPRIAGLGYQGRTSQDNNGYKKKKEITTTKKVFTTKATVDTDKAAKAPCLFCGEGTKHAIMECRKFSALERQSKSEACKKHGLCFGCLNKGHTKRSCPQLRKCSKCQKAHPTIMHDPNWKPKNDSNQKVKESPTPIVTSCIGAEKVCTRTGTGTSQAPAMAIVPVIVKTKTSDKGIYTYAFLDNGSGAVFADRELNDKLHTKTRHTKLFLKTLNSQETYETRVITNKLQIGDVDGKSFLDLPEVYLKDQIPISQNDIPDQENIKRFKHLSSISLPKLPSSTADCIPRVTILVGINVPEATTPLESKIGKMGEPYAIRSPLGWLIYGVPGADIKNISAHFCNISSITHVQNSCDQLENQLRTYMNQEFAESLSDSTLSPSKEDKKFIELMDSEVKVVNGHYQVPLPFRGDDVIMPDNRSQAFMYADHLKRKLIKDHDLLEDYKTFMDKLETKGYSEKVPLDEIQKHSEKRWYIPHHAVKHSRKPARVVFNCPASFKGVSLNAKLLQEPDLTNRLYGILMRWRKENVAIMADIESMYYQMNVPPEERDFLRYLWWPNGDLSQDPATYRMRVHVFGAISSPTCSNYALRRCATDNLHKYNEEVTSAILHDFYVDDFVKSMEEESSAIQLVKDIKECLAEGGFNLCKWMSNSRSVLESIPIEDRGKGLKNLDIHHEDLPVEHTLGVQWDVESDQIGFSVKEVDPKATRRNMLSVISQVYDPIGITAPYILKAKKILQTCCKEKIPWDEKVPSEQQKQWKDWLEELPKLEQLKINRCYKPKDFGKVVNKQLHHFSDASQDGYGTVSYLRQVNEDGDIQCSFVTAKARVAPLKPHTIVKMELAAATTAVKVDTKLKKELDMSIDATRFWTDSQTVLKYIMSKKARLPVFVANRVAVIQDGSHEEEWRYVPSSVNPADHASRGLKATELTSKNDWLKGPSFLEEPEDLWPEFWTKTSNDQESDKEDECQESDKKEVMASTITVAESQNPVNQIFEYYSDWTKLKRGVAWWLRLKAFLRKSSKDSEGTENWTKTLSLEELQDAEQAIVQNVQHQYFDKEIRMLKKATEGKENQPADSQRSVDKHSTIASLDPELQDGVLVVDGRLRYAHIPQNAKHQLIIPKNHHISTLIIRDIHQRVHHQGRNHVLAELRQKFWVINARAKVKSVLGRCVICRKHQAPVGRQKMADLPTYRVQADEPAFTITGVDYFGPFQIRQGRVNRKRYGIIFTCMNSRAVHIEIAHTMDTSSCIDAIRRFTARRGNVKEIRSDNGSNFVGANNELSRCLQEMDEQKIQNFATSRGFKWQFNPPAASHHGGAWERQIRTIRKLLSAILNEQHLKTCKSDEQLHTLMCEIEETLNSRPLTKASDDPNDFDVITPRDLLLLRPTASLPPGQFNERDIYSRRRWRQMQYFADLFWKRWLKEYLPELQRRQRWLQPQRNLQEGDVVLIVDDTTPRNSWPMGRVQQVHLDKRGLVRSATVKTKSTILMRPVTKIVMLLEQEDNLRSHQTITK